MSEFIRIDGLATSVSLSPGEQEFSPVASNPFSIHGGHGLVVTFFGGPPDVEAIPLIQVEQLVEGQWVAVATHTPLTDGRSDGIGADGIIRLRFGIRAVSTIPAGRSFLITFFVLPGLGG